jgi:hypothetical protein
VDCVSGRILFLLSRVALTSTPRYKTANERNHPNSLCSSGGRDSDRRPGATGALQTPLKPYYTPEALEIQKRKAEPAGVGRDIAQNDASVLLTMPDRTRPKVY